MYNALSPIPTNKREERIDTQSLPSAFSVIPKSGPSIQKLIRRIQSTWQPRPSRIKLFAKAKLSIANGEDVRLFCAFLRN